MLKKPDVRPGMPCEFWHCKSDRMAVHMVNNRRLCAYHSPFDVDWSEGEPVDVAPAPVEVAEKAPYGGPQECGHCMGESVWRIDTTTPAGGRWTDYECDEHARQWWPDLFSKPTHRL